MHKLRRPSRRPLPLPSTKRRYAPPSVPPSSPSPCPSRRTPANRLMPRSDSNLLDPDDRVSLERGDGGRDRLWTIVTRRQTSNPGISRHRGFGGTRMVEASIHPDRKDRAAHRCAERHRAWRHRSRPVRPSRRPSVAWGGRSGASGSHPRVEPGHAAPGAWHRHYGFARRGRTEVVLVVWEDRWAGRGAGEVHAPDRAWRALGQDYDQRLEGRADSPYLGASRYVHRHQRRAEYGQGPLSARPDAAGPCADLRFLQARDVPTAAAASNCATRRGPAC